MENRYQKSDAEIKNESRTRNQKQNQKLKAEPEIKMKLDRKIENQKRVLQKHVLEKSKKQIFEKQ